ncbi:hypothetical protein D3C76_732120 [compost metagenome]
MQYPSYDPVHSLFHMVGISHESRRGHGCTGEGAGCVGGRWFRASGRQSGRIGRAAGVTQNHAVSNHRQPGGARHDSPRSGAQGLPVGVPLSGTGAQCLSDAGPGSGREFRVAGLARSDRRDVLSGGARWQSSQISRALRRRAHHAFGGGAWPEQAGVLHGSGQGNSCGDG